uniref:GG17044 n=1 Tax=Drosophila erecta TaxID=7220 RepID=B3P443_DROER
MLDYSTRRHFASQCALCAAIIATDSERHTAQGTRLWQQLKQDLLQQQQLEQQDYGLRTQDNGGPHGG